MSTPPSSARWKRELKAESAAKVDMGHDVPEPEPGVRKRTTTTSRRSAKMQIDLMVNSFANDFARLATLQIHELGGHGPDALARHERRAPRADRHEPDSERRRRWRS